MTQSETASTAQAQANSAIRLSVVVPVYNCAHTLDQLVAETRATCSGICPGAYEILLIDDGSRDDSWQRICQNAGPDVVGLRLSRNFGQHAALKAGFAHARGDIIVMMDADLEDPPHFVADIFAEIDTGRAEVCFTRLTTDKPRRRRWTSRLFHMVSQRVDTHHKLSDIGSMRGFSRKVRDAALRYGERRPVFGPMTTSLGFRHAVIDIPLAATKGSQSSYTFAKRARLATDYLISYTNVPAHFFIWASGLSFAGSFGYALVIIAQYLLVGSQLPPGLSLLMVMILFLFALLFFGIGIMGIYVSRILTETLKRPLYLVDEITDAAMAVHSRHILEPTDVRRD